MTSSQQDHVILVKRYTSISGKAVLTKFRAALGTKCLIGLEFAYIL